MVPSRGSRPTLGTSRHLVRELTRRSRCAVREHWLFAVFAVCAGGLRVFALSQQMGRPIPESIAWYRGKIATAKAHLQTPEGRAIAEARMPLVESFLADLERSLGQGRG